MSTITTDVCIIGAGSGGLSAASGLAQLGLDVTLIERGEMGGDCLNSGCVPSKALIAVADQAHLMSKIPFSAITGHPPHIDFAEAKMHLQNSIEKIAPHDSQERFEGMGVRVIRAEATFISPHEVRAGGDTYKATYYIIASGARPKTPLIPGLSMSEILTNESLLALKKRPEHLAIIGGGPIGMEMAQAHRRLGCEVTVIEQDKILPREDRENVSILRGALIREGIAIYESSPVKSAERNGAHLTLTISSDGDIREVKCSHIMAAVGRTPNTDTLNLARAEVAFDASGIQTDRRMRTSQSHIFAIGDITKKPRFTHAAGAQAGIVVQNIAFKIPAKFNAKLLPRVTYTRPEVAHIGMTEDDARNKYNDDYIVTSAAFSENDRSVVSKQTKGQVRVICRKNGTILGVGIIGPHAGELISLWTLAVTKKMKLKDIAGMVIPYPTLSEVSKRAAGAFYTPKLFSPMVKKIVQILKRLPF